MSSCPVFNSIFVFNSFTKSLLFKTFKNFHKFGNAGLKILSVFVPVLPQQTCRMNAKYDKKAVLVNIFARSRQSFYSEILVKEKFQSGIAKHKRKSAFGLHQFFGKMFSTLANLPHSWGFRLRRPTLAHIGNVKHFSLQTMFFQFVPQQFAGIANKTPSAFVFVTSRSITDYKNIIQTP